MNQSMQGQLPIEVLAFSKEDQVSILDSLTDKVRKQWKMAIESLLSSEQSRSLKNQIVQLFLLIYENNGQNYQYYYSNICSKSSLLKEIVGKMHNEIKQHVVMLQRQMVFQRSIRQMLDLFVNSKFNEYCLKLEEQQNIFKINQNQISFQQEIQTIKQKYEKVKRLYKNIESAIKYKMDSYQYQNENKKYQVQKDNRISSIQKEKIGYNNQTNYDQKQISQTNHRKHLKQDKTQKDQQKQYKQSGLNHDKIYIIEKQMVELKQKYNQEKVNFNMIYGKQYGHLKQKELDFFQVYKPVKKARNMFQQKQKQYQNLKNKITKQIYEQKQAQRESSNYQINFGQIKRIEKEMIDSKNNYDLEKQKFYQSYKLSSNYSQVQLDRFTIYANVKAARHVYQYKRNEYQNLINKSKSQHNNFSIHQQSQTADHSKYDQKQKYNQNMMQGKQEIRGYPHSSDPTKVKVTVTVKPDWKDILRR